MQVHAADAVGIHHGTLSKYERDRLQIPAHTLLKCARLYNRSVDWLATGYEYGSGQNLEVREKDFVPVVSNPHMILYTARDFLSDEITEDLKSFIAYKCERDRRA